MADASDVIGRMLDGRRLERVTAHPEHARRLIDAARRHIQTARIIAATDDDAMAFTAAYDGARKALAAVLAVEGLRVRPIGGAHRNTVLAAAVFVTDDALTDFDWMRQVRNSTEYPDDDRPTATRQDVVEGIDAAEAIVTACARHVEA